MREATNRILELVEEGLLDRDTVIMACLKYMSEDEVADMAHANEFFLDEDEDEEDEEWDCDDSDDGYALASAGFGTDEDYGYAGDEY
jgi:hypothetical protein